VPEKEDNQQLLVKLWGNKGGQPDFNVGDHIAVTNINVEHFNSQVSVSTTDEMGTEILL